MVRDAEEVSLKGFDLKALDDAINAKNWLLRFPQKLEAMFERDTGAQRCHELIVRAYIGIVIYDLFAFADWWVTPELFWTALWVRLAFFTPVSLLLVATLYTRPGPFLRESIICLGGGAIAMGTIIYLMALSGNAPQDTLHESMTLVVLFLTVVQRIRFSYLAPTCLMFLGVHVLALAHFYHYSVGQQVATNMVFARMPVEKANKLRAGGAIFHDWIPAKDGKLVARIATAFATPEEHVARLIQLAKGK